MEEEHKTAEEQQVITLDYKGVTAGRAFSAHLFDFFSVILLGILILVGGIFTMQATPIYKDVISKQNEIQLNSHLYVQEEEDHIVMLSKQLNENNDLSYNEKNEIISNSLTYYFDDFLVNNSTITNSVEVYTNYLTNCKTNDGKAMFDIERNRLVNESIYDQEYFNAYYTLFNAYAIGYLSYVDNYVELRSAYIWCFAITILICLSLSVLILLFVVPMIFSKGKRTFGMMLNQVGYVSFDGFSPSWKRFLLHFLFQWLLIYIASIFSFLIPLFISVAMIFFGKNHQSLTDYVTGCFMVNNSQDFIYKDYQDYLRVQAIRKEAEEHPLQDNLIQNEK
ncbi:MAG: RDD family protein [Bacilli bacterium]|nr:RDD family protein [Bacilli bacterium]